MLKENKAIKWFKGTVTGKTLYSKGNEGYKDFETALKIAKKELIEVIRTYQNPYPKDIFLWDSESKLDFSRGRFNKHCYQIVENMRSDLLKEIKELIGGK